MISQLKCPNLGETQSSFIAASTWEILRNKQTNTHTTSIGSTVSYLELYVLLAPLFSVFQNRVYKEAGKREKDRRDLFA